MEKIIHWKSFDGKIFESETECQKYEAEVKAETFQGRCLGFNENLQIMDFHESGLVYLYIADPEALEWVVEELENSSIFTRGLDETGYYIWDDFACEWMLISDIIMELQKAKDRMKVFAEHSKKL